MTFFGTKIQNFLSFKIVLAFHSIGFLGQKMNVCHSVHAVVWASNVVSI